MIKPLTSLRFFFAFFVFLSHIPDPGIEKVDFIYKFIFHEGFLGVGFFFVLSGFILAYTYQHKLFTKTVSKKNFYIARFSKIYPIHFLLFFVAFILLPTPNFKVQLLNLSLFQSFIPNKQVYFSMNAPAWSISDEFFFYAIFPLAIPIISKLHTRYLVGITFAIIFFVFLLNIYLPEEQKHYWLYISPFTRVFDFLLGIALFAIIDRNKQKINRKFVIKMEFLSIFLFLFLFGLHEKVNISYRYSIYYWLPILLIIASFSIQFFNSWHSKLYQLLSSKFLIYLGDISFCFYMCHFLVIKLVYYHLPFSFGIYNIFVASLLSLILSVFLFEFFEKPVNKALKRLLIK